MLKMATYPGMTLGGEIRESISIDEDELSDVEDEVFIRDCKNGYKIAEEINVKRPLMAPRRKLNRSDISFKLKNRPPCKLFCKPCCYATIALSVLIGVIALIVVLVSIFPLPLDNIKDWVVRKSSNFDKTKKLLPCNNLEITNVWSTDFPFLTSDSPIRSLDINGDGIDDILFGFGTNENINLLSPEIICPIFLGVSPPCEGGVIALNGLTGSIIWRYWLNDTIFALHCTKDINNDGLNDCLIAGMEGTLLMLNTKNGTIIWKKINNKQINVYIPNFIDDQNNDSIADIISAHTSLSEKNGHLILFCGKTGNEIKRMDIPYGSETFFMPQLIIINETKFILFGSGNPLSPGNLSLISLNNFLKGEMNNIYTIYEDHFKGILTQSVLVDITGDNTPDIITSMFNTTLVAINGKTLQQIWNFTINNSESDIIPTPAYFNNDNITDFLIIYEKYNNNKSISTNAFIIDGKTGIPIYDKSINNVISSQMSALTLSLEGYGMDMFIFWTYDCINFYTNNLNNNSSSNNNNNNNNNNSQLINTCNVDSFVSNLIELNAMNQYDQPPGLKIFKSFNQSILNMKSPLKQIKEYIEKHNNLILNKPEGQSEIEQIYTDDKKNIKIHKYGSSNFRHKENNNKQQYSKNTLKNTHNTNLDDFDYDWQLNQPVNNDFNNNYNIDSIDDDRDNLFDDNRQLLLKMKENNRDPRRSKNDKKKLKMKNLSNINYGIYDYKNIVKAHNRLFNDLNNLPTDILKETYFNNKEDLLKKSKFEARDINSHIDKLKENEETKKLIDNEKKLMENNMSLTLWDLESEKELLEKNNGNWRNKRNIINLNYKNFKITSTGIILKSINSSNNNSLDLIFIIYWQSSQKQNIIEDDIKSCVKEKQENLLQDEANNYQKTTENEQKALYVQECITEQDNIRMKIPYLDKINDFKYGQISIFRITINCICDIVNKNEKCANILPHNQQSWISFMGKYGDGYFNKRN